MKRIGIIGGMSFESTLHYYEQINRKVNEAAGRLTSADMVLRSVNFEEYHELMEAGDWDAIAGKLESEAFSLIERNGCNYVAIATNTMHKVADKISSHEITDNSYGRARSVRADIPLVHIGDCIAEECLAKGYKRVALIGTKFTMTDDFMKNRLQQNGLEVVDNFKKSEIQKIDRIIFDELCHGIVKSESAEDVMSILMQSDSRDQDNGGTGFDAVILGCTELGTLIEVLSDGYIIVKPKHEHRFEFVDSTQVHIDKLVNLCLS